MGYKQIIGLLILSMCFPLKGLGQEKKTGPIIKEFGAVWQIETPDLVTDTTKVYRAVFDIMNSPEAPDQLNTSIETVARYLNMHGQSGVSSKNIKAVIVVHNKASKDLLQDTFYRERFGVNNPNKALLESLIAADVEVLFCGQSSLSRNIPKEQILPEVRIALSAMTALIDYQDLDYRLIKF